MTAEPEDDMTLRALLKQTRATPPIDPARAARVRQAVRTAWVETHQPSTSAWPWWIGIGAAAAAAFFAVAILRQPGVGDQPGPVARPSLGSVRFVTGLVHVRRAGGASDTPLHTADVLAAGDVVVTRSGRATITLPDAVEIRLDRDTAFVMEGSSAVRLDRGALYLDTSPRTGPGQPIDVTVGRAIVRDIGTRYEVRTAGDGARVRVREGRVQATRGAETREATAGSEIAITPETMLLRTAAVAGSDWGWIVRAAAPPLIDGRTLAEFLSWVEREGGWTIRFEAVAVEQAAGATTIYGTIDGLTVDEALATVLPSCGLGHRVDGDVITIVAADPAMGRRR